MFFKSHFSGAKTLPTTLEHDLYEVRPLVLVDGKIFQGRRKENSGVNRGQQDLVATTLALWQAKLLAGRRQSPATKRHSYQQPLSPVAG